ncbi:hypothetical protein AB0G06_43385 [Nonomuraea dietziae]|uniref:hypothetical protein n=1 Tax=Nonomuraea dietziae TaxID=65515 RepID=UPI0033ED9017
MTSEELAKEIASAVLAVQARILGVGKEQYDEGSQQKFELMSLHELIDYAMEEVEDGIAYNVMLRYKLTLLKKAVDQAFTGYSTNKARHAKPAEGENLTPPPALREGDHYAESFDYFQSADPRYDELRKAASTIWSR